MNFSRRPFRPVWHFLNQPLFDLDRPLVLKPKRFWLHYQVNHLERCWTTTCRPEQNFRNG